MRIYFQHKCQPPIIKRKTPSAQRDNFGVSLCPVTEVDKYFDEGFHVGHARYGRPISTERALNDPERWTEVEACLRDGAVSARAQYERHTQGTTTVFRMPVVGHVLVREDMKKVVGKEWLFWKGRFHDPGLIYKLNGWKLRPLCSLRSPADPEPGLRETIEDLQLLARDEYSAFDCSRRCSSKRPERLWKGRRFLQMDLGTPVHVQALVVLGGYPRDLSTFPPHLPHSALCDDTQELQAARRGGKYVQVVREEQLAWTTTFDLYFRDLATRKWRLYGAGLEGNADVLTERVHRVNLLTRCVRIVPVAWHCRAEIRCRLYGATRLYGSEDPRAAFPLLRSPRYADPSPTPPEKEDFVEYELQPAQTQWRRHDGIHSGRCWCCSWPGDSEWRRRSSLRQRARHEYEDFLADI